MRSRGITLVDLVVVFVVFAVATLFFVPLLTPTRCCGKGNSTRCQNNLRQIGLAATQYCDDKRLFPHFSGIRELDPGWKSSTSPRAMNALVRGGYLDNPDTFVCPGSPDMPAQKEVSEAPLHKNEQLSYGWTRLQLWGVSRGAIPLAGDKARLVEKDDGAHVENMVGNHKDVQFVVFSDAHTWRVTPTSDGLNTATISLAAPGGGWLGALGDDPALGQ